MKVERDGNEVVVELAPEEAQKLASQLTALDGEMRSGSRAFGSLLTQAGYERADDFRQPPHAFDENAPKQPSIES
ncbi:MAG: hypothetical protein ACK4IT_02660 [Thioalkalivibrionaceae bacterium]